MQILTGHTQNKVKDRIEVDYGVTDQKFWVRAKYRGPFHLNREFSADGYKNWELWNYDVLELFLTRTDLRVPYIELQISPLNQKLALLIKKPRKSFEFYTPATFKYSTEFSGEVWNIYCELDAADIPGGSPNLRGNIHCGLGPQENRRFYGLNINQDDKADFHKPLNFISLGRFDER